jgi:hypothetical protein
MKEPKLSEKQAAMVSAAKICAQDYIKQVPPLPDEHERRERDFLMGFFKALKQVGINVLDETTLSGIKIVETYEQ